MSSLLPKLIRIFIKASYSFILINLISCGSSGENNSSNNPANNLSLTKNKQKIVFLGDSLTEGYTLDQKLAYPNVIQEKIIAQNKLDQVFNLGVSGDTSADGLNRINQVIEIAPDIFIIALGTNDSLRGQDLNKLRSNLIKIIETVQSYSANTKIILAGFKDLRERNNSYSAQYEKTFKEISDQKGLILIPDLLVGVQGVSSLNLSDKIHPNAEGQKIIAETVWQYLSPLL